MSTQVTKTVRCDLCGAEIDVTDEQTVRNSILSGGHYFYNVPVREHNPAYDEDLQIGIVQEPMDLCPACADRVTAIDMEVVPVDGGRSVKHVYSLRDAKKLALTLPAGNGLKQARLLARALPFIEGQRDEPEWDEVAVDLADAIKSVLDDYDIIGEGSR